MKRLRPAALLLGPDRGAVSGVSTHLSLLFGSPLAEEFELHHFQVGSEGRHETRLAKLLRFAVSPVALAATVLARRASIVHVNTSMDTRGYWRDVVYTLVAKLCGAKVLYQVHGGELPERFFEGPLLRSFLRRTLHLPDAVVVLAREELDAYRRFVPDQHVFAIPNAVDTSLFEKFQRPKGTDSSALKLLYIGRLHREKGLYEALEALKMAQTQGVRAHFVIAGSGPEEKSLRRFAEERGLNDTVAFAGPVFGDGKLELLSAADVFLLPSYREGLPYALLESMAAGTPVITTRVGGIPDVVTDRINGMLVPRRDADAIARAIVELACDPAALGRMSEACRRTIEAGYSIERQSREIARLYWEMRAPGRLKALPRSR